MRIIPLCAAAIVAGMAAVPLFAATFEFACDKPGGVYSLGEKATITVAAFETNKVPLASGKVKWRLNNFGDATISEGTFDASKGASTFSVSGTMNEPGFMRLDVTGLDEQGNPGKTQFFGVAYDPYNIKPGALDIQRQIDDMHAGGGGRVTIPAGRYETGPIHLRSNVELHFEDGAELLFTDDINAYLPPVETAKGGVECLAYSPLIYANGATNIAITGRGRIAPRMGLWECWRWTGEKTKAARNVLANVWGANDVPLRDRDITKLEESKSRPQFIGLRRCRNVRLEDFKMRHSPSWCVHLLECDGVEVRNIDIEAFLNNNDGIDIESSRNVLVEDCRFSVGDDIICLKSGKDRDGRRRGIPTENVVVRRCVADCGHAFFGIGSELSGGIRNAVMEDCVMEGTCAWLFRIKTTPTRAGFVENVAMRRVKAKNITASVLNITDGYGNSGALANANQPPVPPTRISGVTIEDVSVERAKFERQIRLSDPAMLSGLSVTNLTVKYVESNTAKKGPSLAHGMGTGVASVEPRGEVQRGVTFVAGTAAHAAEPPLMMVRLRGPHTADDAQWAKTFKVLSENRAACDEVWFSTGIGFPKIAWHEEHVRRLSRYAEQLRSVGIVPSLQFQATLGHSDGITALEGADGKTWGGFTGRGGVECKYCNCPRQKGFVGYVREMARLYASFRPGSVWIDDDLRITNHSPGSPSDKVADGWIGCWCATCMAEFNAETGGSWTRETLDAAMAKDAALFDRWEKFSFEGIAAVARAIAEETHKVSPGTRLAYQHGGYRNASQLAVFRAMHEATGLPVGSRPGGGWYFDYNPNDQMIKAFYAAQQRQCLGNPEWIAAWCPEIETYPRAFASRTAQGVLNEAFANLALGMNSLSLLIMDTRYETDEWYGEALLAPLASEKPFFEEYRRHNAGAVPAGLADTAKTPPKTLYGFALTGVPVLPGPGRSYGEIEAGDTSVSIMKMSSSAILDLRRKMDARSGGRMPVLVETPTVGLVVPQVAKDGALRSVALVNARIDEQEPVKLRLRGVPAGLETARWWQLRGKPVVLPVERFGGGEATVVVPALSAWNCGWLAI